ncbi:MAG: sigma-54 dependent transcriptional regulator [bacterium]|nr:sigma-54 dependent transcriptional regulator [bacterium]
MVENFRILLVDDDESLLESLEAILEQKGYSASKAHSGEKALKMLASESPYHLAVVDLKLPGMDGLKLLETIKAQGIQTAIIVLTGNGSVDSAVKAMKLGACDYLEKPVNPEAFLIIINKERERQQLIDQNAYFMRELSRRYQIENIVGDAPSMKNIFTKIQSVALSDSTVLITGESGTGKELIANHIHYSSSRRKGPLVKVSCATLGAGVLESELFGHERGAFTGAINAKPGRFELANGGTLFLDEVGDLPLGFQTKLLRVLQSKEFERVGGIKNIQSDFRLIAATNHDLKQDLLNGTFREDIYYRLNVIEIEIPPLRQRKEDVPLLLSHFINIYAQKTNKPITDATEEARSALCNYRWPGNVREFKNVIESAFVFCQDRKIGLQHLPAHLQSNSTNEMVELTRLPTRSLREIEMAVVKLCLEETRGNRSQTAQLLGITRGTLHSKMRKYNL